jgi:hypothetical protein
MAGKVRVGSARLRAMTLAVGQVDALLVTTPAPGPIYSVDRL